MKLVYVAGPFRGPDSWMIACNVHRAAALALEVWKLGAACICPHLNTAQFQGAADDSVWLDGDIEILRRCDAVILTPDWSLSSGARAEVAFAYNQGIPIFTLVRDLKEWISLQAEVDESRLIQRLRTEYFGQRKSERLLQIQGDCKKEVDEITARLLNYFDGNTQRGS